MSELKPDLCIIGDSAGGLRAALLAAAFGVPAVLIRTGAQDEEHAIGRLALLAASAQAYRARHAKRFGIETGGGKVDFAAVMAHVRHVQAKVAPRDSDARLRALGLHVIHTTPRFLSTHSLQAGEHLIAARRFILSPGAKPIRPDLQGLEHPGVWTPHTVSAMTIRPERLAVIGGGAEALEFAQAFCRLGSHVSLIAPDRLLPQEDDEQAALLASALRRDGVQIVTHAPLENVSRVGSIFRLGYSGPEARVVEADSVLLCLGDQVEVDAFGLAAAGIGSGARGIHVDTRLRTDNPAVFALGPAAAILNGSGLNAARAQADAAMRQVLFRFGGAFDPRAIPRSIFTDPEFAACGWSEAEARARHGAISVLRSPFASHERALAEGRDHGHATLILDRRSRLLGASITGPGAAELIVPWAALLGQKPGAIRNTVPSFGSFADTPRRALLEAYAPLARSKPLRALSAFLRRFG